MIVPNIGFAVHTRMAGDTPQISANDADSKIGEGPQVIIYDASMVSHKGLRDFVLKTADDNEIPYQYASIAAGGTDSGSIHLTANGGPALSIGSATHYILSHVGRMP